MLWLWDESAGLDGRRWLDHAAATSSQFHGSQNLSRDFADVSDL